MGPGDQAAPWAALSFPWEGGAWALPRSTSHSSLVLNGVCVGPQLCMVLRLIILHHFYPIQSYLM